MRGVREDEQVRLAVDAACQKWDRAIDAWETVCWALSRDPTVGKPLNEAGSVRGTIFDGARSIKMPSIDVIYTYDSQYITLKDARFYDSPHHYAGQG